MNFKVSQWPSIIFRNQNRRIWIDFIIILLSDFLDQGLYLRPEYPVLQIKINAIYLTKDLFFLL